MPSLARSVPKPLKVPSLARSVPKAFKMGQEGEGEGEGCQEALCFAPRASHSFGYKIDTCWDFLENVCRSFKRA